MANEARASVKFLGIAPNKIRFLLNQIRGLPVDEAKRVLLFSRKSAAYELGKLLDSAVANGQNVLNADPEELIVSRCWADEAAMLKRIQPRAQGRAYRIRKRQSHITICVEKERS